MNDIAKFGPPFLLTILSASLLLIFEDDEEDLDEDQEAFEQLALATSMLWEIEHNRPGRGYMSYGATPKPRNVPPFNELIVDWSLSDSTRCIAATGWTPLEFNHVLPYVEEAVRRNGGRNGGRFRACKADVQGRLFMLLWFLNANTSMRRMELIFCLTKSSICLDLFHMANILNQVLKVQLGTLWPVRAERDAMRLALPEALQGTGIFFLVDTTKSTNVDSVYPSTRRKHWNNHKRFGAVSTIYTDIFGSLIKCVPITDGNGNDNFKHQISPVFLLLEGIEFGDDETGFGDSHYHGASNVRLSSKSLVTKFTTHEINNEIDINAKRLMKSFNHSLNIIRTPIEQTIGGIKRGSYAGDRAKIRQSLHTNNSNIRVFFDLAAHLHAATMRMRGQIFGSNPATIGHDFSGVNLAAQIINENTHHLYTVPGYKNAFFGAALSGLGFGPPAPIPLNGI
jgi:hypothetical protein